MIATILLVFALVFECLAAFNIGGPRFNLMAAGLACFFGSILAGKV